MFVSLIVFFFSSWRPLTYDEISLQNLKSTCQLALTNLSNCTHVFKFVLALFREVESQ